MEIVLGFIFGFFAGLAVMVGLMRKAKANPAGMSATAITIMGGGGPPPVK